MNELTELAELRADVTGRRPEDLARARGTLDGGIRAARRGRLRPLRFMIRWPRTGSRPGTRIALTGVIAVAAAVAVTAAVLAGAGPGRPPARHGGTLLTVAYVLGRAATAAARGHEPVPRPDQYIYVASIGTALTMTGGPPVCKLGKLRPGAKRCTDEPLQSWLTTDRRHIWLSASGRRTGVLYERQVGQTRLPWGVRPPRSTGSRVSRTPLPPLCHMKPTIGTYTYLTGLPTSPRALRAWLYRHPDGGQAPNDQAWTDIGDLLREMLVPPKLAAALFRVAATIPGARVVPHATDAAGRPGIAVARHLDNGQSDAELIFDPRSYQLLGEREVLTKPVRGQGPPGTVVESTAQLAVAVVNRLPQLLTGGGTPASSGGCPPRR